MRWRSDTTVPLPKFTCRRTGSKANVNIHWKPFWATCEPCYLDYDVIAHVETFAEDQEFVIRELGLQNLLQPAHTHASK